MISITKRGCLMGRINNRIQKHGEEPVTAFDIPLASIVLDEHDLNALLADPKAHEKLFSEFKSGSKHVHEPSLPDFEPLVLKHKLEDVQAELYVGMAEDRVTVGSGTLANIVLTPKSGGSTELSARLSFVPDLGKQSTLLLKFQGHEISVELHGGEITKGDDDQADLGLPGSPPAEKPKRGRNAPKLDA